MCSMLNQMKGNNVQTVVVGQLANGGSLMSDGLGIRQYDRQMREIRTSKKV